MKRTIELIVGAILSIELLFTSTILLMFILLLIYPHDMSVILDRYFFDFVEKYPISILVFIVTNILTSVFLYKHVKKNTHLSEIERSSYVDFPWIKLRLPFWSIKYYYDYIWKEQKSDNSNA